MGKYKVECIDEKCGWKGFSTDCFVFRHSNERLFCPDCKEVVESVITDEHLLEYEKNERP